MPIEGWDKMTDVVIGKSANIPTNNAIYIVERRVSQRVGYFLSQGEVLQLLQQPQMSNKICATHSGKPHIARMQVHKSAVVARSRP